MLQNESHKKKLKSNLSRESGRKSKINQQKSGKAEEEH